MKKIPAFILSAVMCLSLCSCSNSSSEEEYNLFSNGLLAVKLDKKWGYINEKGEIAINPQFEEAYAFADNGLARVTTGSRLGYIDKSGKYVINPQFDYTYGFDDSGLAPVKADDKWGYIDQNGNYVISPIYDKVTYYITDGINLITDDGYLVLLSYDKNDVEYYNVINTKGEMIFKAKEICDRNHYVSVSFLHSY